MEKKLNHYLADLVVEYHKLQNFHWYVKGEDFFPVHAKLEELYNGINSSIDEVAENILMIHGKPLASLKEFLENSGIEEAEADFTESEDIFEEVVKDFNILLNEAKEIRKFADEKEEYIISALMDGMIAQFTKSIWMIGQSLDD